MLNSRPTTLTIPAVEFCHIAGEMVSLMDDEKGVVRSARRELGKMEIQPHLAMRQARV